MSFHFIFVTNFVHDKNSLYGRLRIQDGQINDVSNYFI